MSNNTTLDTGSGGDTIWTHDNSGVKLPGSVIVDIAGVHTATVSSGGALLVDGSATTQPVSNAGTFPVQAAQSGTFTVGISAAQAMRLIRAPIPLQSSPSAVSLAP